MPTYEYRCVNGHSFDLIQRMAEDALTNCTNCGASVQRVFHAPAVHFKGSGFYHTDYGRGSSNGNDSNSKDESKKDAKTETKGADSSKKSSDSGGSSSSSSDSSSSGSGKSSSEKSSSPAGKSS